MKKGLLFLGSLAFAALASNAQSLQEGYVSWGDFGQKFGKTVSSWTPGTELNEDDNFFISRVKPKARFRNAATQVRTNITAENDKRLVMWVPIDDAGENALPNGVYDSEVFNMWSYVTHYGNWTAPQGRVPGNFLDVAHKNGVPVSSVAGIPWGSLGSDWKQALEDQVAAGAAKTAEFLHYYGVDGLGYNSEFAGGAAIMSKMIPYHNDLLEASLKVNPLFENMWYDGTNDYGGCTFDQGLGAHNDGVFGGASLFLNYNWSWLLQKSVAYAQQMGKDPLYLYAGMNMQGAEGNYWTTLKDYPISIGLWGAHSSNMFWESRGELGSAPDVKQRTYMLRIERWFTGGSRNPVHDLPVANSMKYNAENYSFHGMSSLMSARSSLSWDLATEPFVTYFNLGNGKFFNWNGVRQHDKEWYNIGAQDYLPTWRWWFNKELLGRTTATLAENGLDAEFTWDDAYMGGSTVRIFGSTDKEYLHLFKTQFDVQDGDVVTFSYKLKAGSAAVKLVMTAVGDEAVALDDVTIFDATQEADEDVWVERKFTVGKEITSANVALIALQFENAKDMDLYLGEFSIVRAASAAPAKPEIKTAKLLAYSKEGVDAKIVFNMANDKAAGEPCYNIDVNASMFKIYAQQEGEEPVLMGVTTSWAALCYNVPMNLFAASQKVRVGVAAVSLDTKSDSEIAWSEYMAPEVYAYSDDIQINKTTIKPNESFEISYVDPKHEEGSWKIYNTQGAVVASGEGLSLVVADGLSELGSYDLEVKGKVYGADGSRVETTRTFGSYVQITSEGVGALPEIYTLTANGSEESISIEAGSDVLMAYTGRKADGSGSQGVDLMEERFGVKCADLGLVGRVNFSVAFWLKINKLAAGETQLVAVANKLDSWPKTDWGWIWTNIMDDGSIGSYTWRGSDASNNNEIQYRFANTKVPVGTWAHIVMTFEYNNAGHLRGDFYINGVKQELTSWKRTNTGENYGDPGYQMSAYNITDGQVLSVGGSAHGRSGIDGVIDNFQVWKKVMTADDVKLSMGDIDPNNLPDGLSAYWDLETEATNNTFKSVGPLAGVEAGLHNYAAAGGEGQGRFGWIASEYTSGCPFVSGTAFPVVTEPIWKAKKATIVSQEGNDTAGKATINYAKSGDYAVTLTLANSLGSDERTFQVIKVAGEDTGIEGVAADEVVTYAVDGAAVVEFAQEGNYTVAVYTAAGQKVASKSAQVSAGGHVQVMMGAKGTYILSVEKDGKLVRSVKLLNK